MADGYLNFDTKIITSGFTAGLKAISAGMAVAVGAAGTAFAAVSKTALDSVASLEQNIGGVETLFKDSAKSVIDNANNAFKTAGMSANAYMQNVTSFSASLLQSLDGDTKAAAKSADMAMIDMSDNANKMGTAMEDIQNAYQGFAKQNYTMLDNLKLGYGGTKAEMERLLADAEKIKKKNGEVVNYSIDSFADILDAIHVVQEDIGITGTTAEEAATTIEGSMNAAKASFDNFLNGSGTAEEFAESVVTAAKNVVKNLEEIVPRLAKTIPEAAGILVDSVSEALSDGAADRILAAAGEMAENLVLGILNAIPSIISVGAEATAALIHGILQMSPDILGIGIDLLNQLGSGLQQGIPEFMSNALSILAGFSGSLLENAGLLVDAGIQFVYNLVDGLVAAIPALIEYGPTIITNLANIINQNVPKLIVAGASIIFQLIAGIVSNIPNLIAHFPEIIKAIIAVIGAVNWIGLGKSIITGIAKGVKNLASKIPGALKDIATSAFTKFKSTDWLHLGRDLITKIVNGVNNLASSIPNAAKNIATSAFNKFRSIDWLSLGRDLITKITSGITGLVSRIPTALSNIGKNAMTAFTKLDWKGIGKNIIAGIASGISGAAGAIVKAAKSAAESALKAAKKLLGIASPSKRAREEVGQMYGEGVKLGILDEADAVGKASEMLANRAIQDVDTPDYTAIASGLRKNVLASTYSIGKGIIDEDNRPEGPGSKTMDYERLKAIIREAIKDLNLVVEMDKNKVGKIVSPTVDAELGNLENKNWRHQ